MLHINDIISNLVLSPHPEGGYFRETYRSPETIPAGILPNRFSGERCYSTAIYFLLEEGGFSAFHKIQSDECWHFYSGGTLLIYVILKDGQLETIRLGKNITAGEVFQAVVPAGCWFASEPAPGNAYVLTGCTVAPGFDFADFELAKTDTLMQQYPIHRTLIKRLCR